MEREERRRARLRLVTGLGQGESWREAAARAGLRTSRTAAYRLLRVVRAQGEGALDERRQGHPAKFREPVTAWLLTYCRAHPGTPSRAVRAALQARFGLVVSISQLNRVRAALGISTRPQGAGENTPPLAAGASAEDGWGEGAGSLLLLAAAQETGLVDALRAALPAALPADNHRRDYQTPASRQALVLTLLFLGAVGLRRTWDLRGYTGDALALLAGRGRPYGYRHVERFLAAVARAGGAETLTDGVTAWAARLWSPSHRTAGEPPPAHYIDGHRKAVYSDALVPRGLVARRGTVLGCRALTLLHDEHGHPLLATTHRGDTHLTVGLPAIVARYEAVAGAGTVRRIIVDREGLAAPLLARLAAEGQTVVTILRANQHAGLDSFTEVGDFTPLDHDATGHVVREVAPARFALPLPDRPGQTLALGVALVRDHRRQVPCGAADAPDLAPLGMHWGTADWVATATPAPATAPKLVPIVTTATDVDAPALVRAYRRRWPCQENVIRDFLLPLGLDTNHGYAKTAVENSEVAKRRATLERRLANARRWGQAARVRGDRAGVLSHRRWQAAKDRSDALYRALNARRFALEAEGVPEGQWRAARRELTAAADAELACWWARYHRALDTSNREFAKHERYCREQGDLLRALADLAAGERAMYELDDAKGQAMTEVGPIARLSRTFDA